MTITLENSMMPPQMKRRESVTHLKVTGLRESLFQLWFSIWLQKNIGNIWSRVEVRLWSRNSEVREGTVSASALWTNNPDEPKEKY